jgi:hypothetical protein
MRCKCKDWGFYVDIEKYEKDTICNECKQIIYTVCQNNKKEYIEKEYNIKEIKEKRNYFLNLFFNPCVFFVLIHLDSLLTRLDIEFIE